MLGVKTIKLPGLGGAQGTNLNLGSPRYGQAFTTIAAPGGVYHQYADGHKVFVKSGGPQPGGLGHQPNSIQSSMANALRPGPGVSAPIQPPQNPQAPADTTGQVTPDYRDASYWTMAAGAQQARDAAYASNEAQAARALAARNAALQQLADQQPKDAQKTRENENDAGLFYSGHAGQALSDLAAKYATQRASANQAYTDAEAQRAADKLGIDAAYQQAINQADTEAGQRALQRDSQLADAGALAAPDLSSLADYATAQAPEAAPAASSGGFKTVVKNGKVYHFYPDGRKVYVRPASN